MNLKDIEPSVNVVYAKTYEPLNVALEAKPMLDACEIVLLGFIAGLLVLVIGYLLGGYGD